MFNPFLKRYIRVSQLLCHLHHLVLRFSLSLSLRLAALVELPSGDFSRLFVPFRDQTSGEETYPAGRYLDLDVSTTGLYDLDFNRAYHPFCYFDETYDCPYPPPQNRLNTAVFAGEKLPPANERRIPLTNYESTSSGLDR